MCKITRGTYKSVESVVLESERIRVEFIKCGARMTSFLDKKTGREIMLQSKLKEFRKRDFDSYFTDCDPAGFDDMFPTIDVCYYDEFPWAGTKISDHGEVWSLDWDFDAGKDSITMSVHGIRFPYRLVKKVYFKNESTIRIDYMAENLSAFDMDFLWTAHPMMQVDEGTRILLPPECKTGYTIICSSGRLGGYGNVFELDKALNAERDDKLAIKVRSAKENNVEKYYIREKLTNGFCKMEFPGDGSTLEFRFPSESVPYLAILVSEGSGGDPNWAIIEPSTALYDRIDIAKANNAISRLSGNGCYKWYLEMELDG
jgi:hypothetical protein